jgi:hypothetical protein
VLAEQYAPVTQALDLAAGTDDGGNAAPSL